MTSISNIIREPLVAFITLGAALYFALAVFQPSREKPRIELRAETIQALIQNDEDLIGGPVSPARRTELVEGLLDDEVLLREARAKGYHETDPRVRQRLLGVMRASLTRSIADPSASQLEAYYRDNLDQFRVPESVSFEQVYFSFANENTPTNAPAFLAALNAGAPAEKLGDYLRMSRTFSRESRERVVLIFGPEFADAIEEIAPGDWRGPLRSRHGVHYVRVRERHPSEQQTYEQVEPFLRQQWLFDEQLKEQSENIQILRDQYEIILPDGFVH